MFSQPPTALCWARATTWRHANSSWRHVSVHTRNPWLSLHQQEMHQGQTHTQFTFRRLNVNCAVNYSKTESACSAAICTVSALLYTARTKRLELIQLSTAHCLSEDFEDHRRSSLYYKPYPGKSLKGLTYLLEGV